MSDAPVSVVLTPRGPRPYCQTLSYRCSHRAAATVESGPSFQIVMMMMMTMVTMMKMMVVIMMMMIVRIAMILLLLPNPLLLSYRCSHGAAATVESGPSFQIRTIVMKMGFVMPLMMTMVMMMLLM